MCVHVDRLRERNPELRHYSIYPAAAPFLDARVTRITLRIIFPSAHPPSSKKMRVADSLPFFLSFSVFLGLFIIALAYYARTCFTVGPFDCRLPDATRKIQLSVRVRRLTPVIS